MTAHFCFTIDIVRYNAQRDRSYRTLRKAFSVPVAIEDSLVVYRTDYGGQAGTERFEIDMTKITEWKGLG